MVYYSLTHPIFSKKNITRKFHVSMRLFLADCGRISLFQFLFAIFADPFFMSLLLSKWAIVVFFVANVFTL
jgi:hypothetical protein